MPCRKFISVAVSPYKLEAAPVAAAAFLSASWETRRSCKISQFEVSASRQLLSLCYNKSSDKFPASFFGFLYALWQSNAL